MQLNIYKNYIESLKDTIAEKIIASCSKKLTSEIKV